MKYFYENKNDVFEEFHMLKQLSISGVVFIAKSPKLAPDESVFRNDAYISSYWKFFYVESGEVELLYNGVSYILSKGSVFYVGPEDTYGVVKESGSNYYIYSFNAQSNVLDFLRGKKLKLPGHLKMFVLGVFNEAHNSFHDYTSPGPDNNIWLKRSDIKTSARPCWQQYITTCLELTAIELIRKHFNNERQFIDSKQEVENLAINIAHFLESNIYNKISIQDICNEFLYSSSVISAKFKEHYGNTIIEHYNMLKIAEAKKMINAENYKLSEISELLQFSCQEYFIEVFKRYVGCSPSKYKKTLDAQKKLNENT